MDKNKALPESMYRGGALKWNDLEGADATVITVSDVNTVDFDDENASDGKSTRLVLDSEEYSKGYFVNKTGTRTIVEQFGDVPAKWIGRRVPLIVVHTTNPQNGQPTKSLQVAPLGEWDDLLAKFRRAQSKQKPSPKQALGRGKKKAAKR